MKSKYSSFVVAALVVVVSGVLAGCTASGSIDPAHDTSTSTTGSNSSYKKTEVRDANGNLIEKKVESRTN